MIYWNKITGSTCADNHPNIGNTPLQYYPLRSRIYLQSFMTLTSHPVGHQPSLLVSSDHQDTCLLH